MGENGIGKSTFIEAIAVALGLPAEGGTQNFRYESMDIVCYIVMFVTYFFSYSNAFKFGEKYLLSYYIIILENFLINIILFLN